MSKGQDVLLRVLSQGFSKVRLRSGYVGADEREGSERVRKEVANGIRHIAEPSTAHET